MTETPKDAIQAVEGVPTLDPEELAGPGRILPTIAASRADHTALITPTRSLTYRELDELSDRVASSLRSRGLASGDRVSLYSQNRWEWVVAYHGALKAGAIVNPVNVMLTPDELRYVLRDCEARFLFASGEKLVPWDGLRDELPQLVDIVGFDASSAATASFSELLDQPVDPGFVPVIPNPASPSTIGYTSGTTGHPKGAVQSHQSVLLNCNATAQMHGRGPDDVLVTALPCAHVYGNVAVNSTLLAGGTVVLMERFDPATTLTLIQKHRATMFEGVPAMYSMLLADPALESADLSSLTRCTVGGQTIALSTVNAWQDRTQAPLLELWGMTELAGLGTTHWTTADPVPGSIGVALPRLELRIADLVDNDKDAPVGEAGELMARGPLTMLGYFGNPEATQEAFDAEGWMHTGDIAYVDDSGHYFVVDRLKDMIVTAGYNIYPAEIERVIAGHPAVAMSAVGPVPDPVKGELARAYVVLKSGSSATEADIINYCRDHLAAYKIPRSVVIVRALPQTSSGKVMRRKLADEAEPAGEPQG